MTTQVVSTKEVTAEIQIEAPIFQIYYLFSTRSGWSDWFADHVSGKVAVDNLLQLQHGTLGKIAFLFREVVPEKRIVFAFLTPDNLSAGEVTISLEADQGETAVTISHAGLEQDEVDRLKDLWQNGLDNMKELMEQARDPRLWTRPFLGVTVGEWVTPEYAAKNNLATEYGMHINSVIEGRGAANAGITGGDTIISLAGVPINETPALLKVYADNHAGDTIDVEYYHGQELRQSRLTLSAFPVPEVPATTHDIADRLDEYFQKVNQKLEQMLEGQNEAQLEYRHAAGEWSVKEVLAHLVASENDSIHWLGSYLAGREVHPYTSGTPARLKSLLVLYPTTDKLLQKLRQAQKELVSLINQIPAEVVSRKASMVRLSFSYSLDVNIHYKEHLAQIADILERAADIHAQ